MNREAERKRLEELLGDYLYSEQIADHLLDNGVVVPPVKVGDVVYQVVETYPKSYIKGTPIGVIVIKGTNNFSKELWEDVYGGVIGTFADIGKTVFTSREEAQMALEGRKEDEGK